ncbi:MAG: bifunctional (p)ppGpp synthetase/guanosine-3',5'-bis(diphosphate) 3'-pyrophosphohydrolase [Gammaproteobacteria bacterium]|nr:bifunctional (p)ppGpp synthetase/guanosine-3',5'-bis(diphosphate) 3'-pyrophosphohydrolase [Gammaproteobacteria bacterium]
MFAIEDLCGLTDAYLPPDQVKEVHRAYEFGARAHEGQRRASGEPYIFHPLEVAKVLAEMRLDHQTIVAALLHDVIEDTPAGKNDIADAFGEDVAELVDGVSKLDQIRFESRAQAQAESFRKMLLAMAKDLRVILVKLADRLHNMRTLEALAPEKRRRIARETLDVYAPIAARLGLNSIRLELEDLGFQALYPMRFRVLSNEMKRLRRHRKQVVKKIETALKRRLRQESIPAQVHGREKHLYSLYCKMRDKQVSFSEVLDVHAFRIIVDTADMCYRALGVVHGLYKPVPGKFKDYIALPKANGYQSLHTVLFGPFSSPIEVQIRTADMHAIAESGIAAHWQYKTDDRGNNAAHLRARQWLTELLDLQKQTGDSLEFFEHVKVDLFPKEVYVFTPAGDIMQLPRGSTPVDLAYAVHTDVGNKCIAAKVDGRYAPLSSVLSTGQNVEIVTAPWGRPNANWLNFVVSSKARSNIRLYLKNLRSEEATELGHRLLSQALAAEGTSLDDVPQTTLDGLLAELELDSLDDLLSELGLGKRIAPLIARRLAPSGRNEETSGIGVQNLVGQAGNRTDNQPMYIRGTEGILVSFARCCHPVPGDPIAGFISAGKGIVVHTTWCKNIAEYADRPERWVDVAWEADLDAEFPVEIRIEVTDRKGTLATVAAAISDQGANIENVNLESRDGLHSTLNFIIAVRNRVHLARIIRRVRTIPTVSRIYRATRGSVRQRIRLSERWTGVRH